MTSNFDKHTARLVAENAEPYGWGNLTLAVQLLLPLALLALIFARKRIWIYPYPLLDTYVSALCPSFSQQQRLLKWMSSRIPHMKNLPNKITQYWQNGSLLCTLINTVVPGACPNPHKHWKKPPIHGQALAYKYLGVAPVLTENDFNKQTLTLYTERKFIKYLLLIQEAINKVTIEEESLKFTSKYVARGMGLVIGEQNRPSVFYIYPNTGLKTMENILVNIKGPYNTFGGQMISSSAISENVKELVKMRKDNSQEQRKLAYISKAERSFFRSVSFDISPIMNMMGNRKNTGEISVKVEMESDRAKVAFLPTFSGIYELMLTNDGQHLQGSPFVIRIMKSNKEVEHIQQENTKLTIREIEREVIGKSSDFVNESITVTDGFYTKLDSNNNMNGKDPKESSESNKSDDESTYQDSGIFDLSDQPTTIRGKHTDLEEIDEDSMFPDESTNSLLDYNVTEEKRDILNSNINKIIKFEDEDTQRIVINKQMPDEITFLVNNFEEQSQNETFAVIEKNTFAENNNLTPKVRSSIPEEEPIKNVSEDDSLKKNLEDIFDNIELRSNQEFENLYNKYAIDDEKGKNNNKGDNEKIVDDEIPNLTDNKSKSITNIIESEEVFKTHNTQTQDIVQISKTSSQNINSTDLEILSNIPQFQKGRKITSVEKMVEIFENDSCNKNEKNDFNLTYVENKIILSSDFTHASPVLNNIVQEAADVTDNIPKGDSTHLKRDVQLSSKENRPVLSKAYSICLDDEGVYDTNVKEIKNVFEKPQKTKVANRRFETGWKQQNNLQESKKKLAKSLPNLLQNNVKDSLEESNAEDEFLIKFKEKRNFWNNLILQNSSSNVNISTSNISSNNSKSLPRQYKNVSQSTNSLNSYYRSNKLNTDNKFAKRKELYKATSLDLTNTYDDNSVEKNNKITRAESMYDRIKIFDKDFDFGRHSTLLKRTKKRSEQKEKPKHPEVLKPESLAEVPNTTSNNQIEEDLRFAEIMKERFEISRHYFCSLESLTTKPNLTRRHSIDSKTSVPKEAPLQKGGSLKVLNVLDKFSLDNIYKDVVLNKLKHCNFKGSPNKEAVVETLSSVSSSENLDYDQNKDYAEEDDLNMQFFNIKKRLRKRRSIKSIFDVNY